MKFSKQILNWYEKARRDMPWRRTSDPYLIWLSEIILQQTRVDQGLEYYNRFAEKYPGVEDLAKAHEKDVLKLWQGLGYYSRARNLLFAAGQVMNEFNGVFPTEYSSLRNLKGVGDYTAAAIASIAFGQAVPVVDGNVKRVISRIFGIKSAENILYKEVREKMSVLIDKHRAGDFNQAVMEFGALLCTPAKPICKECIFKKQCYAYNNGMVEELPVRTQKKKPQKKYFSYLVILYRGNQNKILIKKRTQEGIWKNLFDFPMIETDNDIKGNALYGLPEWKEWFGEDVKITKTSSQYSHQLTHRSIVARFHFIELPPGKIICQAADWELIYVKDIKNYPVPRLIDRFLQDNEDDLINSQ